MDFDAAILAHSKWKRRLKGAIDANDKLDAAQIAKDDLCELGTWIHSDGRKLYGSDPVFGRLRDAHAGFHRVAADVAGHANSGNRAKVDEMLGTSGQFTKCSSDVVSLIVSMRDLAAKG